MSRVWLIIKREYITRVRKASFIITTLLAPLGIALLFGAQIFFMSYSGDTKTIVVKDESGINLEKLPDDKEVQYIYSEESFDALKENYKDKDYEGVLLIPPIDLQKPEGITFHSDNLLSITTKSKIERQINSAIKDVKYKQEQIDEAKLERLKTSISIMQTGMDEDKGSSNTIVATISSYITGFVIYFILIFYGTMVMRGVAEEKNNRIVEVIMSSTKPFKLMMGKIVGIGLVGLTQFALWIVLGFGVIMVMGFLFADQLSQLQDVANNPAVNANSKEMLAITESIEGLKNVNWLPILAGFLFYFLGGYFFYAAFFAAIGTATGEDNESSQSLTMIVTIPIVIALFIAMGVINAPNSPMALWGSIIPFFSPIVMPARLPFGVPTWQLLLSGVCLIAGFILATWLAAKIYRVGILIYGKKITLKELGRWLFYKG